MQLLPSLSVACRSALIEKINNTSIVEKEILLEKLVHLPCSVRTHVVLNLDLDLEIELAGVWIDEEAYWKRRCEFNWKNCVVQGHGGSWKQAFFEKLVGDRLETFDSLKENISDLQRLLAFSRKYIRSLAVHKLPSHLDLELVFDHLGHGPTSLVLKYGPGYVGMDYERTLFGMKLSDSRSLARVLECSELLTSLDISNNLIDDDKIRTLCSGLLDNISLTQINLSKNRISDRGARALAKVLQNNDILLDCNLSDNCVFLDGAHAIARALKANRTLCKLDISLNRLGDGGVKQILEAVVGHPSLTELNLGASDASNEAGAALCHLLERNATLKALDLSSNDLSVCGDAVRDALELNENIHNLRLLTCGLREDIASSIEETQLQRSENRAVDILLPIEV